MGSTVLVQITVTDAITGELANGTIDLVVRAPDGTETTEIPTNPSIGIYQHFLLLDEAGWWTTIWTATVGDFTTVKECSVCAGATVLVGASP